MDWLANRKTFCVCVGEGEGVNHSKLDYGTTRSRSASCLRHPEASRAQAKPHQASEASIEDKYHFAALFLTIETSQRLKPDAIRGPGLYLSAAPVFPPRWAPAVHDSSLSSLALASFLLWLSLPPLAWWAGWDLLSADAIMCSKPRLAWCPLEERGWVGGTLEKKRRRRKDGEKKLCCNEQNRESARGKVLPYVSERKTRGRSAPVCWLCGFGSTMPEDFSGMKDVLPAHQRWQSASFWT